MGTITSPRFTVSINGKHRCIAGLDGDGVLSATFSAHVVGENDPEHRRAALVYGGADLRVGGLQRRQHVTWLNDKLVVGDEFTIRAGEGGPFDPPQVQDFHQRPTHEEVRRELDVLRERLAKIGHVLPARFQILVNGNTICTAGIDSGVLVACLTYTRRDPQLRRASSSESAAEWASGTIDLHVGGLENEVHLVWSEAEVDVGDEVTIRVLARGPIDPPTDREERRPIPHEDQLVVSGQRISQRRLVADDMEFVTGLLANVNPRCTREDVAKWLQEHIESSRRYRTMYMIVDNESHASIGLSGILDEIVDGQSLPAIQCMICPEHRRKGYATRATETCIAIVHDPSSWADENPSDAYALIEPGNEAGLALARKLGMKQLREVQFKGRAHLLCVSENRGD